MNLLSTIMGLDGLVIALVGFSPLLGWLNWFVRPLAVVGLVLGLPGQKTSGWHITVVVLALATIRLARAGSLL
jgi:hypothetical protein